MTSLWEFVILKTVDDELVMAILMKEFWVLNIIVFDFYIYDTKTYIFSKGSRIIDNTQHTFSMYNV